jgi:hypothetical protein
MLAPGRIASRAGAREGAVGKEREQLISRHSFNNIRQYMSYKICHVYITA